MTQIVVPHERLVVIERLAGKVRPNYYHVIAFKVRDGQWLPMIAYRGAIVDAMVVLGDRYDGVVEWPL